MKMKCQYNYQKKLNIFFNCKLLKENTDKICVVIFKVYNIYTY